MLSGVDVNDFFSQILERKGTVNGRFDDHFHYVIDFSIYDRKFADYVDVFGRDRILVVENDHLIATPEVVMLTVFEHCHLEPMGVSAGPGGYVSPSEVGTLDPSIRNKLEALVYPSYERFRLLAGLPTSNLGDKAQTAEIASINPRIVASPSLGPNAISDISPENTDSTLQHQRDRTTQFNRYPPIFDYVKELCSSANITSGAILSFGCSSGEEVATLSKLYFPDFRIIGVDISEEAIAQAAQQDVDQTKVKFLLSCPQSIEENGPYHVIFATSVFCRWPDSQRLDDISHLYPFSKFEQGVAELDKNLLVGGMLVIVNANFDFRDTAVAANYKTMPLSDVSSGFVKRFTRDNLATNLPAPPDCVFLKLR